MESGEWGVGNGCALHDFAPPPGGAPAKPVRGPLRRLENRANFNAAESATNPLRPLRGHLPRARGRRTAGRAIEIQNSRLEIRGELGRALHDSAPPPGSSGEAAEGAAPPTRKPHEPAVS